MTYQKARTCRSCEREYIARDRWSRTCPACKLAKSEQDEFEQAMRQEEQRQAKPHSTREAKHIMTPGEASVRTRETHPHLFHDPRRHGARPKVWPRRPKHFNPCKFCSRVQTDMGSQAVGCYGVNPHGTEVYLRCACCLKTWKMPRAKQ